MAQRRFHYERAFEAFLRSRRIPYVAVDEARKALLPRARASGALAPTEDNAPAALKSFDFVVYGQPGTANLLVDIKGRKVARSAPSGKLSTRLESWVTDDDVTSLRHWQALFGPGFEAAFVFVYWCDTQPPDALFQEVFAHTCAGTTEWYALRAVTLERYARSMKVRSPRWKTLDIPRPVFERISHPFAPHAGATVETMGPELPALLPV